MSNAYGDEKPQDSGRKGYLEPNEPRDGVRPRISYEPFWESAAEQDAYESAVRANPRRWPQNGRPEPPGSYIQRIASMAEQRLMPKFPGVKGMPKGHRLTDAEWNERNNALQAQREPGQEG